MTPFKRMLAVCGALLVACSATVQVQSTKTAEDYDKLMKQVGPSFGALRKHLEGSMAEDAGKEAQKLAMLFKDAEAFWAGRKNDEAAGWSKQAMGYAMNLEKAIAAKDMAKTAEEAKMLGGTCATCHTKYRDKSPDGGFRIKEGQ